MKKKRSLKRYFINRKKFLLFFISSIFFATILSLYQQDSDNKNETITSIEMPKNVTPIPVTPVIRKEYNYEKIMNAPFLTFEDKQAGFAIQYPSEMDVEKWDDSEGEIVFSLIAQHFPEVGKYNGLMMKFFHYDNHTNDFPHTHTQLDPYYHNEFHRREVEKITIAGNKAWKITSCCYDGESLMYYVLNKQGNRYLIIAVYPMGQDQEFYLKIVNKMLGTLRFLE